MVGLVRLDDRPARAVAATGRPDGLGEQLVRPLRGALVGQVEGDVGRDDADQRHLRDVEALRDEARADEDVERAAGERVEDALGGAPALDHVPVEPADAQRREAGPGPPARPARCRRRGSGSAASRRPGSAWRAARRGRSGGSAASCPAWW